MTHRIVRLVCAAPFILVAGCMPPPVAENAQEAETTSSVIREQSPVKKAAPAAASAPLPSLPAPLQMQEGPKGTQVALTRVAVTGDVLTVQLSYRQQGDRFKIISFPAKQVSVIDDQTSQRLSLLQDNESRYLASPMDNKDPEKVFVNVSSGSAVAWFKFPAPTGPTVSINIPEVGPFDGVPVARR